MKGVQRIILTILLTVIWIAVLTGGYVYWRNNPITKANDLKARAKDAFFARKFVQAFNIYQTLFDSTAVKDEASSMNYANSAFMASYENRGTSAIKLADSTRSLLSDVSDREYSTLSTSSDNEIASIAFNQQGYKMLKADGLLQQPNADSALIAALDHFKNALRRNPENDSARYNYVLVKKLIDYPQATMKQVQSLVAAHRYREALELLERGMKKVPSMQKQAEFHGRLKQIVRIDSIYGRSR